MQKVMILMEQQRTDRRHTMSTEIGSTLQVVVRRKFSICMEEAGRSVQQICTVCLAEIVTGC